jgi:hypothetical protein
MMNTTATASAVRRNKQTVKYPAHPVTLSSDASSPIEILAPFVHTEISVILFSLTKPGWPRSLSATAFPLSQPNPISLK